MNQQTPIETRESYFTRAESWIADREAASRLSRRIAWIVAGVAAGIAMLEAVALAVLIPLKTVVPYTLLVDRHTGYAQALKGTELETITADAALTEALLAQYVIAREGFDIATLNVDYRKVALWSADRARSDYLSIMPASNPASPLQRYPRTSIIWVRVKSVSPLGSNVALVRFDTERRDQGGASAPLESWAAVLRFRFVKAPMALEERLLNPLGFQVVQYRRDQEALRPEPASSAIPFTGRQPVQATPSAGATRP